MQRAIDMNIQLIDSFDKLSHTEAKEIIKKAMQ